MTTYKLTYFGVKGKAELIRWVFTVAGKDYEDNRITGEEWPKLKNGLYGKSSLDKLYIDQAMDGVEDIRQALRPSLMEKDATKKAEMRETFCKEKLPGHLANYEKLLKSNKGGDGYFVGDELSVADLTVTCFFNWMSCLDHIDVAKCIADYPKLAALTTKVEAIPKLKAWIDSRPVTAV